MESSVTTADSSPPEKHFQYSNPDYKMENNNEHRNQIQPKTTISHLFDQILPEQQLRDAETRRKTVKTLKLVLRRIGISRINQNPIRNSPESNSENYNHEYRISVRTTGSMSYPATEKAVADLFYLRFNRTEASRL